MNKSRVVLIALGCLAAVALLSLPASRATGTKPSAKTVTFREDKLNPLTMGEAFAQDISSAQKVIIEQCGHVPQIEKAPAFNSALLKFLAGETATKN